MEKSPRIMLAIILAVVIIQFIVSLFFVSPDLKNSMRKLQETQQHLDSASTAVYQARSAVDSIQLSLNKFNNYVLKLQAQIDLLHKERELKEARFKAERDSIVTEIKQLKALADTIELPVLTVYDSRKK